ncbi:DUF1615 domain-containing protein [Moraxella nasovis]|nr:DUF1615 domain-containing protein [Moraxella nasovis]UNU74299.1 DUF1615 domain-containing protein [Moraxella nasovis]
MAAVLSGCTDSLGSSEPKLTKKQLVKLIPKRVQNRESWANDIADIFATLKIEQNATNICTVIAVIDQESNFQADPKVANLGAVSLAAIDDKLTEKFGKNLAGIFKNMLKTKPTTDNNFIKQIKAVKTERELDLLYQQIFDYFTDSYNVASLANIAKLTGEGIDERINPVTTLGSMQVHINYARDHRRQSMNDRKLREDLYSQYGGLYYGIHRLMTYKADYDKPLYRFADYNSGMYSSRNAAFQQRIASLSKQKIDIDGDLLIYDDGSPSSQKSQSELALIKLLATTQSPISERQIRSDLKKEKTQAFEKTAVYQTINDLFSQKYHKQPTYAIMPQVVISGPKLSKDYNTNWYATRVDKRYQTCMASAKRHKLL